MTKGEGEKAEKKERKPKKDDEDKEIKKKEKKKKTDRKPSPYNEFMARELPKIKKEHPELDHKQAFKMAAQNWKTSPDNPKNKS